MTIVSIDKDPARLTMTLVAEFVAPVARVWELWENPRLLERWWGPPTYPATFVDHDLTPGGHTSYFMTGPDGDRAGGWWRVLAVDAPKSLAFEDGFADQSGAPNPSLPSTTTNVTLDEQPAGHTRMTIETTFPSLDAMEQMVAMGMEEGLTLAVGQIDALLTR
jgi:uncharacterized protein YndB with AHSA1/START domain